MRLDDEAVEMFRRSRRAHLNGNPILADELHRAIRRDHGCELYYEVELPEHLMLVHPIGCVLGRATYGDYFCAYQGSGIGSDLDGNRPVIGEGVVLFPGAKVLGRVRIGDNVFIQANTVVTPPRTDYELAIPSNSVVFMASKLAYSRNAHTGVITQLPSLFQASWKPTKRSVIRDVFKVPLA